MNLKFVISYCRTLSVPTNTQSCPMTMMWEVVKKIPTKIFYTNLSAKTVRFDKRAIFFRFAQFCEFAYYAK